MASDLVVCTKPHLVFKYFSAFKLQVEYEHHRDVSVQKVLWPS